MANDQKPCEPFWQNEADRALAALHEVKLLDPYALIPSDDARKLDLEAVKALAESLVVRGPTEQLKGVGRA